MRALSAGSGERVTGALETGALETGALETGALETGALETGAPTTGPLLRDLVMDVAALAVGEISTEPLGMGGGKPRVRWVSAPRGSGAVASLLGALALGLSTGLVCGMTTASRTGAAPGRDRTRRSCDRDGSLVC